MKSICQWLCPKRKKAEGPYDVHEETFEMDEHFGEIDFAYKNQSDPSARTVEQEKGKQESSESLSFKQPASQENIENMQDDQKKFIEIKNKIQQQPPQPQPISQPNPIPQPQPPAPEPPKPTYNILPSKVKKKAFNPEDYFFKTEQSQFRIKPLDSIKGQQFNIDGCKNGTYFIFDITANIYIDDCEDCFIFAAPCESSIFVRSCKRIVLIGIVGQFRTYNCHDCHFSIYCKSQPVIESSSNIHFSSLQCPEYPELRSQFAAVKLYPWNNNWSQIHNFTKKEGETHHFLDREPQHKLQIDWQRAYKQANLTQKSAAQNIVPFIQGVLPIAQEQQPSRALIIFNKEISEDDEKIMQWVQENQIWILRASKSKVGGQKYFTVAMLIGNYREDLDFEAIGNPVVITDAGEIRENEGKYFVSFKDER